MKSKKAVFAFYHEQVEELKERFEMIVRAGEENVEYHTIVHLDDVLEIMENKKNHYSDVYLSSVRVFDDLEDFWWFSEVVLGNGANYFIDEEGINSRESYHVWGILAKLGNCFN